MKKFLTLFLVLCAVFVMIFLLTDYRIFECHVCDKMTFGQKTQYNLLGMNMTLCRNCLENGDEIAHDLTEDFLTGLQEDVNNMFR